MEKAAVQRVGDVDADPAVQVRHGAHRRGHLGGGPVGADGDVGSGVRPLARRHADAVVVRFQRPPDDVDVGELLADGLEQGDQLAELVARADVGRSHRGRAVDQPVGVGVQHKR